MRSGTRRTAAAALALATLSLQTAPALRAGTLYDFEAGTQRWTSVDAGRQHVPVTLSREHAASGESSLELTARFPGLLLATVEPGEDWTSYGRMSLDVLVPRAVSAAGDGPGDVKVLVYLKDRDLLWYQVRPRGPVRRGEWTTLEIDMDAGWEQHGHFKPWDEYSRQHVSEFGLQISCTSAYRGPLYIDNVKGIRKRPGSVLRATAGSIYNYRVSSEVVPRYGKFEISFDLDGSHENPFSPEEIDVRGHFLSPEGEQLEIPGFFYQGYERRLEEDRERLVPYGRSEWKIRFAPAETGRYSYHITVKDRLGTDITTKPRTFTAVPSDNKGFIRVSPRDYHAFELDSGAFFYPVGHNIRSPSDTRYAKQFKTAPVPDRGTYTYDHFFNRMAANHENFVEVWMASWWLALEWTQVRPGYHGVGRYNLQNAWKLDHLLDEAQGNGIYVSLVINNHGKFSTFCDMEWESNPFNSANGGFLASPEEFFTDEEAKKHFKDLMRYIVARWGYSTHVFSWKLWSEINLVGDKNSFYHNPVVREWHREMGRFVKDLDPWDHLVTTHFSGDYKVQDKGICTLPERDYNTLDGYYKRKAGGDLKKLINQTCIFNEEFKKPAFITEFGGEARGGPLEAIKADLHAGLWAGYMSSLAGTPLLWWWGLIDDMDLYGQYDSLAAFADGEDRRGKAYRKAAVKITSGEGPSHLKAEAIRNETSALLWIYAPCLFTDLGKGCDPASWEGSSASLNGLEDGSYTVQFWDTDSGTVIETRQLDSAGGIIGFDLPEIERDIACKIKRSIEGGN